MGSQEANEMIKELVQFNQSTCVWRGHSLTVAHSKHIAGCYVLQKESSERFDCRSAGLRKPCKITRRQLPLTVTSLKRKYWYHVTSCGRTRYVIWGSLFHVAVIIELFPSQRRPLIWPLMWKVTSSENVSCSRNSWDWVISYLICWQKSDVAW